MNPASQGVFAPRGEIQGEGNMESTNPRRALGAIASVQAPRSARLTWCQRTNPRVLSNRILEITVGAVESRRTQPSISTVRGRAPRSQFGLEGQANQPRWLLPASYRSGMTIIFSLRHQISTRP